MINNLDIPIENLGKGIYRYLKGVAIFIKNINGKKKQIERIKQEQVSSGSEKQCHRNTTIDK